MPVAASQVLPAAVILAVIITFGLLSRHNETIAIKCAGLNMARMLRPILLISLLLSLVLLILNLILESMADSTDKYYLGNQSGQKAHPGIGGIKISLV